MEKDYFLPWELAARLALLGFNEPCITTWGRAPKGRTRKPRNSMDATTFWEWELREGRKDLVGLIDMAKQGHSLNMIFRGRNVAAATYEPVMDWFTKVYNIDFIERPSIAATKKYVCDPVGPGFTNIRLEAKADKYDARLCCIEYLVSRVKAKIKPFTELNDVEFVEDPEPCEVAHGD
jgi:hypothetical protein